MTLGALYPITVTPRSPPRRQRAQLLDEGDEHDDGVRGAHPPDSDLPIDSFAVDMEAGRRTASSSRRQRGVKV